MKESFEKKPRNIETEADSYEVRPIFSMRELLAQAETYSGDAFLAFLISKDNHILYLALSGHEKLYAGKQADDYDSGGTAIISNNNADKKFRIERLEGVVGSSAADTSREDLRLINLILRGYLDKINKAGIKK